MPARLRLIALAATLVAALCVAAAPAGARAAGVTATSPAVLARFGGGHFGGGHFGGGGGFGQSRGLFGGRARRSNGFGRSRRHGIFRRILQGLALGALLHFLFGSGPGIFLVLVLVFGVVFLISRRRRRRAAY